MCTSSNNAGKAGKIIIKIPTYKKKTRIKLLEMSPEEILQNSAGMIHAFSYSLCKLNCTPTFTHTSEDPAHWMTGNLFLPKAMMPLKLSVAQTEHTEFNKLHTALNASALCQSMPVSKASMQSTHFI